MKPLPTRQRTLLGRSAPDPRTPHLGTAVPLTPADQAPARALQARGLAWITGTGPTTRLHATRTGLESTQS